tara:strand:- start:2319 stop:3125 length:807 start_codon:yes stop_codon:yes gene_type:complete
MSTFAYTATNTYEKITPRRNETMTDEWKPNKELIDWAKEHFAQMSVGGVWMPEGSGLTYVKEDEKRWRLKSILDSEEAKQNHDRMKMLMWDVGIIIVDDEPSILPVPENDEQAYMQEIHMKREIAQSWADKDGTLLLDMEMEDVYPEFVENKEILLDDGNTTNVEIWAYKAFNPNTGESISIDPDDYHLLMGDKYFMRFKHDKIVYTALSRQEMVESIDAGKKGVAIGSRIGGLLIQSSNYQAGASAHTVPPWMWGTYCSLWDGSEEE